MFGPHPADPVVPPDWRWRRATTLRCASDIDGEDAAVREAILYLRDMAPARRDGGPRHSARRSAWIEQAQHLYESDAPARWVVEARMLARQAHEEIADLCGLEPEVIDYYGQLFFDVAARLDAWAYITLVVIGQVEPGCMRAAEKLLKQYAFHNGPLVIDDLVHVLTRPKTLDEILNMVKSELDAERLREVLVRLAVASQLLAPTRSNLAKIERIRTLATEARSVEDNAATVTGAEPTDVATLPELPRSVPTSRCA
jgi:hypothetical protein